MRTRIVLMLALVLPVLVPVATTESATAAPKPRLTVEVLSNRADLVSGGDVLVAVRVPRGVRPATVRVRADGRDVTKRFTRTGARSLVGLVTGLDLGRNRIRATAPRARPGR